MDSNELFWATGINNGGLRTDAEAAIAIFQNLSLKVGGHLDAITAKYKQLQEVANVKFTNPVDTTMIAGIKTQIESLGKSIDLEIQKLGNFTAKYDESMSRIGKSASKLQVPGSSPLAPMVAGIKADVSHADKELSFLERRFKYAFGSMAAYGTMRILSTVSREILEVKTQFEFLQTAINSFAGSAEKGVKIMNELTNWATNTPLQVNDITEAAKQLMAFGIEADNVVGQIKMLTDVASGAGKPIKDIAYIYGKSLTEGKVYTRTLMQFGNLGIPIYKALADVMDTTPAKIKKMTQLGAIGFDDVKRAIESLTASGGQYYAFSAKMMGTTAGLMSNLKDKWILAMKDMGESNDGMINAGVKGIDYLIQHWKTLGETIVVVATAVGSYQVAKLFVSWTAEANLAAVSMAKLKSVVTSLNLAITNNPYAAAFVAVSTLVAVMWALHDSTTAAEKAQKNLKVALDAIDERARLKSKMFSDNLDIIKNKTLDNTPDQIKAYQVLHNIFGAIIGDKTTLLQLQKMESTPLQNAEAQAGAFRKLGEKEKALKKLEADLNAKKADYKAPSAAGFYGSSSGQDKVRLNKEIEVMQLQYNLQLKDYNTFKENYRKSRIGAAKAEDIDTYEHWSTQKKDAEQHIKDMGSRAMDALKAGTAKEETKKYYKKQIDDIRQADVEMAKFPSEKREKAIKSAIDTANEEAAAAAKRLEDIKANNEKLIQLNDKSETDLVQATIDAMDAGYAKEKATQQNNFNKKTDELKKQGAELLKLVNKNIEDLYLNSNPKGTKIPVANNLSEAVSTLSGMPASASQATSLASAKQALETYSNEVDTVGIENASKMSTLLDAQLKEYGDYTAEKLRIDKKYDSDIAQLRLDRITASPEMKSKIDSAVIQANVNRAKDQMSAAFNQLKSTPEFAMAFEDLGNVSTATLEKLIGELDKLKTSQSGAMGLSDFKVYAKELEKLTDEFIKRNPFKALKDSAEELKIAQKELESAKDWQRFVNLRESSKPKGEQNTQAIESANDNVAKKTDNVTRKQYEGVKALEEITDAYGKLSKEMSSIGDAIGGTAGLIISSIGDIGSFVTTSITAWEAASVGAATAIQAVEKASVILAAIAIVIGIATKVISLITNASKEQIEAAKKARASIIATKEAYLDAYAEMTNKKFDNIFGEDTWGRATAQAELMKKAALDFVKYQNELKTFGNQSIYLGAIGTRNVAATIETFDLVAAKARLAGMDVNHAAYASLKALIESYESYQSYLDDISSYLSSVFGNIGSSMMDSFTSNYDNLTRWADDVTGYISDSFGKMVNDIIYSMYFADILSKAQNDMKAALTDSDTNNTNQIQSLLLQLTGDLTAAGTDAAKTYQDIIDAWTGAGGDDWTKMTDRNSTTSAIKGMDQNTADILTAQFSALRIHSANIDTNISKYFPELLISLQSQTSTLQLAFADVAQIRQNTMRIPEMVDILKDIKTYGIIAL